MNARTAALTLSAVLAASVAAADPGTGLAKGHDKKRGRPDPVQLEWKRDAKAHVARERESAPNVPELPDDLRVVPRSRTGRVAVPVPPAADPVADHARRAADEMALEAARVWGFRQYWRAGFARGFEHAMEDPRVAAADQAEGFRYGRLDPRALLTGQQLAQRDAEEAALAAAEARVREQFLDLGRAPRRDERAAVRAGLPTWSGPYAVAPVFEAVFVSMPIASHAALSRDGRAAADGWRLEPAVLARDRRISSAYEASWKDASHAFDVWRGRQRPGSLWSRFSSADRDRFRSLFVARFDAELEPSSAYGGWRSGYEDGWRYAASARAEWAYREGYAQGFDTGVRDAAAITWPFAFDHAYGASYRSAFARWSTTPYPAVTAVRLVDANDDGVVEPGERVFVEADLANYGGASGSFDVRAESGVSDGGFRSVTLRARSTGTLDRPIELRVAATTPNRTDATVTVRVGEEARDTRMRVVHPLAIGEATDVVADYLGGSARVEVQIENLSRHDLQGVVQAASVDGGRRLPAEAIHVPAGRSIRASFVADAVHPLDLIGGRAQWRVTVDRDRKTDDERIVGAREVATDLESRDLLLYMVDLARDRRPSREDVAEARALFLDRMRADWHRAVRADGNPYKRDVENGSATTALGDLARTLDRERRGFASDEVFDGLGDDIASFSEELPGAHPLLRKWMKRLAKRIG